MSHSRFFCVNGAGVPFTLPFVIGGAVWVERLMNELSLSFEAKERRGNLTALSCNKLRAVRFLKIQSNA